MHLGAKATELALLVPAFILHSIVVNSVDNAYETRLVEVFSKDHKIIEITTNGLTVEISRENLYQQVRHRRLAPT